MKRKKTTDSPQVTIKIPLEKFIREAKTRFQVKLNKLNLNPALKNQVINSFESAISEILVSKFANEGIVELVQFPLGSLSASGKFDDPDAGSIVYVPGTEKHKPYIRKWVNPKNTLTAKRIEHRTLFKQVSQQWKHESDAIKSLWNDYAKKIEFASGQTMYIKHWFKIGKETGQYPKLGFKP
ncbi:MAG: hypothetical protein N3A72_03200 [bacterium]|nr:hypothetical protein [bacterium]